MNVEFIYTGEVICYDEDTDKWEWNGRSYTSLSSAKKAINKKSATDFGRVPCLVRRWGKWFIGEITSKADNGGYWATVELKNGLFERRVEREQDLYQDTPENREIVKKMDVLYREADDLLNTLAPVSFPVE